MTLLPVGDWEELRVLRRVLWMAADLSAFAAEALTFAVLVWIAMVGRLEPDTEAG